MSKAPALQIGILGFDEVEVLDLAGPYEVFTTAARMAARMAGTTSGDELQAAARWQVHCISQHGTPVRARAGLVIQASRSFAQCPRPDVLVVPGGVVDQAAQCPATQAWVAEAARHARLTASVCTGVFILASAGVVRDELVTTHWEDLDDLRRQHPGLQVREGVRWVEHGTLLTSAGISAGIDMSLHLVARLAGQALAERTARQMDYRWLQQAD
ncbi:MAG: DJ-1/PfpI family protein [Curvibacter lanceolatus]|uniref:DJ-1/PfpI family protein n=1 Tax=Curvibacter lanceolatus TaxID=86182 RepID=UPI00235572E0|nr:DJ-1/PfpI family protein [Curvibacter lanceolatus]MBV5291887.1 DJ-1/PfpI family protein [Curvibacter lanceolatus]